MNETPKTLAEAVVYYRDPKICIEEMIRAKWPDGRIACPKCGGAKIGTAGREELLQCNSEVAGEDGQPAKCGKQFSVRVGTVFEDSKLPLWQWLVAVWCSANEKMGISAAQLARVLPNRKGTGPITRKTAWLMLMRIREAMDTPTGKKLFGEVEGDETFIGGKSKNMHKHRREKLIRGRGAQGKAIVQGLLQRSTQGNVSQFRGFVVGNTTEQSLCPNVVRSVEWGAALFTDAAPAYFALGLRHMHYWIDHATEFVKGRVHVNGCENFWSLFKRMLHGTYVAVASFHLHRYLAEETFRFNTRNLDESSRFALVLRATVGKRLTYRRLTAQGDCGFMGVK